MAHGPLKLLCAEADIDTLEVSPDTNTTHGERQLWFHSNETTSDRVASIYLDEETARKLFNYLGIWLHQH